MKRKCILLFLIFIVLIVVLLTINIFNYYKNNNNPSWSNVHIYIKKDTLTPTSATIICENKNKLKYDCYFFDEFFIDKKEGDTWSELPILEPHFVSGIFNYFSDDGAPYIYETNIDWEIKYGELLKGETYRIRFEPGYYNYTQEIENSGQLTVEFTLSP